MGQCTYSYFGLNGETAPTTWTTYRKSFGLGEAPKFLPMRNSSGLARYLTIIQRPLRRPTTTSGFGGKRNKIMADGVFFSNEHLSSSRHQAECYGPHFAGRAGVHSLARTGSSDGSFRCVELAAAARAAGATPVDRTIRRSNCPKSQIARHAFHEPLAALAATEDFNCKRARRRTAVSRFLDFSISRFPNPLACARGKKKRTGGRCAVSARNGRRVRRPRLQFPASAKPSLWKSRNAPGDSLVKVSAAVR